MQLIRTFLNVLLVATAGVAADAPTRQPRPLTLEQCIQEALQHNFDVRIQRYAPELARYNLNVSYAGYDPTFSLDFAHTYRLDPGGLDDQNRPYLGSESSSDGFGGGFTGLLPWGLSYNLGGDFSDRVGSRINPFEITSGTVGGLQLRQPLLKNFWTDATRLNIAIDKNELKTSELVLRQQFMTTVTSVENAYYNLIYALEDVNVQKKAFELADQLLAENKKRVEVGAMAPLDEEQAKAQVAASRANLLAAQRALEAQQNLLKNLLTGDYQSWHQVVVQPTSPLSDVPVPVQVQDSWYKGLTQRPDLLQSRASLERQNIVLKYQKNQLFPQLDLVGTYGYSAARKEYSDAFEQIANREAPFWSYRVELSIPLGNRAARNNLKVARATTEQLLLQLKKLEQTVMVQIDDAVGQVRTSFERVGATKQASLFAEAALNAEKKKLENGKSTSFVVLQLQRDLTAASSAYIRALADYNIALSNLAFNEGATLERNRIDINVK